MKNPDKKTKPMSYGRFKRLILKLVSEAAGPNAMAAMRSIPKNNGLVMDGLMVRRGDENISPTVYVNDYYDAYLGGTSPKDIAGQILAAADGARFRSPADLSFFTDFDRIRDRIIFRLVSRERNAALLESVPHRDFLDLAVTFHVLLAMGESSDASVMIRNEFLPIWGTDTDELSALAQENTPRLLGWEMTDMAEILTELSGTEGKTVPPGAPAFPMHVLTNRTKLHGAAAVLYDGVLEQVAERLGGSFYILPSSVHEVLAVPETAEGTPEKLSRMVREVNGTQVPEEEVLADHAYYYDAAAGEITVPQEAAEKLAA